MNDTCVAYRDNLTAQLPTAKPGKAIPTRTTVMVIVRDTSGRVLLQRRGATGVWSGLWSLPETDNPDDAWREAQRHATVEDVQALTPFVHVFSHYKLKIEPLLFDASTQRAQIADNPSSRWCTIDELAKVGLPAPVRSLLLTLP